MTQFYTCVAIGTAATVLAAVLVVLRAKVRGRQLLVALAWRWARVDTRAAGLVLGLLGTIAVFCFAFAGIDDPRKFWGAIDSNGHANVQRMQNIASTPDEDSTPTQALKALRVYADQIDAKSQPTAAEAAPAQLPDVNTMITKLVARLEAQPNDVKGWKMLGWSYLNLDRPKEATRAYETALELEPGDIEIKKALDQAKSAQNATTRASQSQPTSSPTAHEVNASEGLPDNQRDSMIRRMVDQLATRLQSSPNDEEGWLRLIRSRMTLGERDAARAALTKALETFAGDGEAKKRLSSMARELGVVTD